MTGEADPQLLHIPPIFLQAVDSVDRGLTKSEAARTFGVSRSSVKRYAALREGGSLSPKKQQTLSQTVTSSLYSARNETLASVPACPVWKLSRGATTLRRAMVASSP